jgi:hypothetical protein
VYSKLLQYMYVVPGVLVPAPRRRVHSVETYEDIKLLTNAIEVGLTEMAMVYSYRRDLASQWMTTVAMAVNTMYALFNVHRKPLRDCAG